MLRAQACDEEKLLGHLGVVLYEYLGEEYPEVLGSILGALKSIVNVIGMTKARARARPCALHGSCGAARGWSACVSRHGTMSSWAPCIRAHGRRCMRPCVPRPWHSFCHRVLHAVQAHAGTCGLAQSHSRHAPRCCRAAAAWRTE